MKLMKSDIDMLAQPEVKAIFVDNFITKRTLDSVPMRCTGDDLYDAMISARIHVIQENLPADHVLNEKQDRSRPEQRDQKIEAHKSIRKQAVVDVQSVLKHMGIDGMQIGSETIYFEA